MRKKVMILRASHDQIPMIEAAREMGLYVIAVDGDENAPGFAIADEALVIDVMDADGVLAAAKDKGISGITTMVSNLGMRTVARVAAELGLPAIGAEVAELATDKEKIKEVLASRDVAVPRGFSCSCRDDAKKLARDFRFPVVCKPADGTKGRGISMAKGIDDLDESVDFAFDNSPGHKVIVEEMLQGPTVGAECLIIDGELWPIMITDKFNTPAPWFATMGLTTPSNLPQNIQQRVVDTAAAVARALSLTTGAAHIDMIVQDGVPHVVDVGPRLCSGPVMFDFAPSLMGVDMIKAVIQMAIGETPEIKKKWNGKYGAEWFISASDKGCSYEFIIKPTHVRYGLYPYKELGEPVLPAQVDGDRVGCITVKGNTYEETVEAAKEVIDAIEVRVIN